jgi:hypothetical protein
LVDDAEAHAAHAAQVAELQQVIAGLTARLEQAVHARDEAISQADRTRPIAEPPNEKFMAHGSYTVAVDSLGLELTASCGVSPNACPRIFTLFARFFGVTIAQRIRRVRAKGGGHVQRNLFYIPSRTHSKELGAIGGEVHNI